MTVEQINEYLLDVKCRKSKGTLEFEMSKMRVMEPFLTSQNFDEDVVDKKMITKFISYIVNHSEKKNTNIHNATINKYVQVFRQVLEYTYDYVIPFKKLPEEKKIIEIVKPEDIKRVIELMESKRNKKVALRDTVICRLLIDTGVRANELVNLTVGNIDFENRIIKVARTKTHLERYVFFRENTKELLEKYIITFNLQSNQFLLFNYVTKEQMCSDTVASILEKAKKKLGIVYSISPHKWRHTFATDFIKATGNLYVLQKIMGHTSIKTTEKYLHVNVEYLSKIYNDFQIYPNL